MRLAEIFLRKSFAWLSIVLRARVVPPLAVGCQIGEDFDIDLPLLAKVLRTDPPLLGSTCRGRLPRPSHSAIGNEQQVPGQSREQLGGEIRNKTLEEESRDDTCGSDCVEYGAGPDRRRAPLQQTRQRQHAEHRLQHQDRSSRGHRQPSTRSLIRIGKNTAHKREQKRQRPQPGRPRHASRYQ